MFLTSSNRHSKPIASRFLSLAVFIILFVPTSQKSQAQASESNRYITLEEAIRLTLSKHPEMSKYQHLKKQYDGQLEQSKVGTKPELNITVEDAFGSGDYSGFDSSQTTVGITWVLDDELIDSRVNATQQAASQVNYKRQIKALDLSAQTAKIFINNIALQEQLKLAMSNLKQTRNALKLVKERNEKGRGSTVDVLQMEASVARAELTVEDLEHELKSRRYELMSQWGEKSSLRVANANLFSTPALTSPEIALNEIKENPALAALANKSRVLESKIELARIEAEPRWSINAGIRRYERTSDYGVVAGFSMPRGTSGRTAGKIRALKAEQSVYEAEVTALKQQLNTQLFVLLQEIKHSQHVIRSTQDTIIPLMKKARDEVNKAYELGRANYLEWFNVRQDYLAAHLNLISTYKTLHLQHIELQRLTGTSIQTLEN